jgi:hypothetical protein
MLHLDKLLSYSQTLHYVARDKHSSLLVSICKLRRKLSVVNTPPVHYSQPELVLVNFATTVNYARKNVYNTGPQIDFEDFKFPAENLTHFRLRSSILRLTLENLRVLWNEEKNRGNDLSSNSGRNPSPTS